MGKGGTWYSGIGGENASSALGEFRDGLVPNLDTHLKQCAITLAKNFNGNKGVS